MCIRCGICCSKSSTTGRDTRGALGAEGADAAGGAIHQAKPPVTGAKKRPPRLLKQKTCGDFAGFHSQSEGTQGNPLACLFFCLSAHSSLLRAQRRLKAAAPWAVVTAQMDGGYLFGPADAMDAAEADLRADLN
jgi:hypothetical protein